MPSPILREKFLKVYQQSVKKIKLDKTRKLRYLPLRKFWPLLPKIVFGGDSKQ